MVSTSKSNNIDTSKFQFIGVENQYVLAIAVKNEKDNEYINFFNQESDLISYLDVSRVGFELPAVEIVFGFSDPKLLGCLNERNTFIVAIGPNKNDLIQSSFNIITSDVKQKAAGKWLARIVGIYDKVAYLKNQKRRTHVGSSCEIAQKILEEALNEKVRFLTENVKSRDPMIWLQSKESDYRFLYRLWLHSSIPNSIWLTAVDFTGIPFMTDLRKQAKNKPIYTLTTGNSTDPYTFSVLDAFDISDNSSAYNNFGGYQQVKKTYDMDQSRTSTSRKVETVVLSNSDSFNRISDVGIEGRYNIKTSNVYSGFYAAPMHNKSLLLALKSFQLGVSSEGKFLPAKLLDFVMFKDVQPDGQADGSFSGAYLVGKIAHQIVNKKIYTHIDLWRESTNSLRDAIGSRTDLLDTKMNSIRSQVDASQGLMNADSYNRSLAECEKIREKADRLRRQVEREGITGKAYRTYKELDSQYKKTKNYLSNIYGLSTILTNALPESSRLEEELLMVTEHTEAEKVQSLMRRYLNLQEQVDKVNLQLNEDVNSTSVYENTIQLRSNTNRINSIVEQLRTSGIIGDPNEYDEFDGN